MKKKVFFHCKPRSRLQKNGPEISEFSRTKKMWGNFKLWKNIPAVENKNGIKTINKILTAKLFPANGQGMLRQQLLKKEAG